MNKKRLSKLADYLETVPRRQFDYSVWVGEDWKGKPDLSCGTKACALGWATTVMSFRKAGLRMVQDGYIDEAGERKTYGYVTDLSGPNRYKAYKDSIDAGESFFELTHEEACFLFLPGSADLPHETPKAVAKHIRKFVEFGGIYK